ncbi:EAL domain-containing protein [Aestuariicella hydrocarbonica]|uniref:EAL domain-containing protein n=1 Tax=Pseudomaricurvus hydrocarbonicus TaxID=1470433 RepID=A0A9E5JWW2_9GAMM|nr:EAL domain-containing protein [Aestuariicella hydrocarbonica]NHO66991.1 EAL domain-containing protein [Aestuariicella hydrocarbonica]
MNANETIRLLILNDSRKEVERLISMLNNAGRATRAQHVESEEVLTKLLQEQTWDLLIAEEGCSQLPPETAARQIKRLNKDVPVILISDALANGGDVSQAVVDGIKLGAADVVQLDQDQHLLLVIQRELDNREQRQQRRRADHKLKETERRSQKLLDSSRDAIAYVQDGMYLYANQSFADTFGYSDRDDIECMPVIDMVDDEHQTQVKQFLKDFTLKGEEAESSQLEFNGVNAEGAICRCQVTVTSAIYDEENCIQFLIHARAEQASDNAAGNEVLQAELQKIKDQDTVTGLYNRLYLVEQMERAVSSAIKEGSTATALYIEVDNFSDHIQHQMGVAGSDLALANIAQLLKSHTLDGEILARFGDDSFMLLARNQRADASLARAEAICKQLEQHIIDVDGKTAQATVTIGVSILNENSTSAEEVIDQALKAVESYRKEHDGAGNGADLYNPEISPEDKAEADLLKMIQGALDNSRFKLMFQPIISLRGAEDEHYEVLLRMLDDNDELVAPGDFLPAAGQLGLMTKIDRWVILETIKTLSSHRAKGNNTRVIINLSRESLCDETLAPWIGVAFKAAGLNPDTVVFQVDETHVTNHLNAAKALFHGLNQINCQTSISNFGCSLNPFKTLSHAPSDYVKVHGSFTLEIQNNTESPEAISSLIKQLLEANTITIVPLVENAGVLSTLWQTGVHYIQGNYLQAPTEAMDFDFNMEG